MYGSFHTGISEIPGLSIYYKIYQAKMSDDKLLSVTQAYNSIFSVWDFSQQRLFFHFVSMHSKVSIKKAQLNQTAAICTFNSSAVQEHLLASRQRNISK